MNIIYVVYLGFLVGCIHRWRYLLCKVSLKEGDVAGLGLVIDILGKIGGRIFLILWWK